MRLGHARAAQTLALKGNLTARGGALCAVPAAGSGGGTTAEFLPLALLLAGFTGAAVWMFRRWGGERVRERDIPMPVGDVRPANA